MDNFAGLDVSVKETSVCFVNDAGKIVREVKVASVGRSDFQSPVLASALRASWRCPAARQRASALAGAVLSTARSPRRTHAHVTFAATGQSSLPKKPSRASRPDRPYRP
jgi:hypothetical protein